MGEHRYHTSVRDVLSDILDLLPNVGDALDVDVGIFTGSKMPSVEVLDQFDAWLIRKVLESL